MNKMLIAFVASALACACSAAAPGSGIATDPFVTPEAAPESGSDAGPARKSDAGKADPTPEPLSCDAFGFSTNACGSCAKTACCDVAAACMNDAECSKLSACLDTCGTGTAGDNCVKACAAIHPTGVRGILDVNSCAETKCASSCKTAPAPKGIGDRCTSDGGCRSGKCSAGGWCTASCSSNVDCSGYPQLNNEFGKFNYCLATNGGSRACFPGCSTNADCAKFGSGATCKSAGSFSVCTL